MNKNKTSQVNHDLYRWLVQREILPNNQKYKSSGNFELEARFSEQLLSGYLVGNLLIKLAAEKNANLNQPLIASIKNSNTPAARVYNWNILQEGFAKIGVTMGKQMQKEITSGNFETLVRFLLELQHKNTSKQEKSEDHDGKDVAIDVKKIKKYEEIENCETVLEYILVLITRNLGLTSKQAVATLSESGKYLAHMFVKGIKGSFEEIQAFLSELTKRMPQIMYLTEKDPEKNMQLLLQILKPTLISRDSDVAKSGSQAFKAFNYQSLKYNGKNIVYQLLCKENQGFDFLYMGLKRHPQLNFHFFQFLFPLLRSSLFDFLEIQLKKTINNQQQYIRALIIILQPILYNKESKKFLLEETQLFPTWVSQYQLGLQAKMKKDMIMMNEETKILRTQMMLMLWMKYYKELDEIQIENLLLKLIEQLKRATRSEVYVARIPSLLKIFDILDFLAENKNKLAALVYKKIIFLFVENHESTQLRQIMLESLITILQKFPTIPLQFLLEPLLKQLNNKEGTSYILNVYDFDFIIELCRHPKMQEYYAISFLEYFTRLYVKSIVFSTLSFRVIEVITARFCQSQQIRQYCLHSAELNLNHYSMLVMGKSMGNKAQYNRDRAQTKEDLIIKNQKKSLIIQLLKHYIELEHRELTNQIMELVVKIFVEWYENKSYYDKGLASILMIIGDIEEIVMKHKEKILKKLEEDAQSHKSSEDNNLNRSRESEPVKVSNHPAYHNQFQLELEGRDTPILHAGMGYKKNKHANPLNSYELMLEKKVVKPDPKVMQDLERIKDKWKLEQSRTKIQEKQKQKQQNKRMPKINSTQLLQRNLSLGYMKLPNNASNQILFDFDSVKTKNLKDSLELIDLNEEEERDKKSVDNIIHRYRKYIKNLFHRYASKSMNKGIDKTIIAFTQIMRMLKQKNLMGKIPKIAINQVITTINKKKNQRNVLAGIQEEDFPTFIIFLTYLIFNQQTESTKDQPFGLKVEKVLLKMFEEEKNVRELFDPKILKLKQQIDYNNQIEIPSDYKKVKEVQIVLDHYIIPDFHNVQENIVSCYEIVEDLVYQALGIHIISPATKFIEKVTLARNYKVPQAKLLNSYSTDKHLQRAENQPQNIKKVKHNSNKLVIKNQTKIKNQNKVNRTSTQRDINSELTQQQKAQKQRKRDQYAKKFKKQMQRLKQERQKHEAQKLEQAKKQEQRKKKKEELRQQYLEENKKKLKQAREQQQIENKVNKEKEKMEKEKKKAEVKNRQAELLEKEKKNIQKRHEIALEKKKKQEFKEKEKQKMLKNNKNNQKALLEIKNSAAEQKMKDLLIKNSLQKGQLKAIMQKHQKEFTQLFQSYWIWDKEKMDLKGLAQMLKDFSVCNDYVTPKMVADTFKNVTKGQYLNRNGFEQCIAKLSFKSAEIEEECKKNSENEQGKQKSGELNLEQMKMMIRLLKMEEGNYKQVVIKMKNEN